MQTFAPLGTDIVAGFRTLDYRRLGKQRVEALQILNALRKVDKYGNPTSTPGWVNHPATKMWAGNERALARYGVACCIEWCRRGYNDTLLNGFLNLSLELPGRLEMPDFLNEIADSHKSNLIRKNPVHYKAFWPDMPDDIPYVWPTPSKEK